MSSIIKNNSNYDLSQLTSLVNEYYPYAKDAMGFSNDPAIIFESDLDNAANPLGKTAHYNPSDSSVTIYVDNRHPKDIMRSLNHELVHHKQNCQGKFENLGPTEEGYAQSDPYLREMEEEAYMDMTFRDWENQRNIKEKKTMNLNEEKLRAVIKEAIEKALGEQTTTDTPEQTVAENESTVAEENEEIEEGAKPDFLDLDKDGDTEESMKDAADDVEENLNENGEIPMTINGIFAPNHYCVHHGGVNHDGATKMAEAISHNYNEEIGRVTHYDMKLEDGTILEGVAFEDIQVTNASLAEGHGHPMKRDDEEEEEASEEVVEETTEEITEKTEEEVTETPIKEWYNGSLYGKLLKEYTKKR